MNKTGIIIIIFILLSFVVVAPFTFQDQVQGFLSFFSNSSEDQNGSQNSGTGVNIVDTKVSRVFNETTCFSFITPEDPGVIELRDEILQDSLAVLTPDWMKFRDWVGNRIDYKQDSAIHGEIEFWQFPNETIQLLTGDCEDFSILLCSLLRSNGWEADSVYVIIGQQNNMYHGWVRLIWKDIQYNIEPQGSGFELFIGDMTNLSGFEAMCYFNDQEFGTF